MIRCSIFAVACLLVGTTLRAGELDSEFGTLDRPTQGSLAEQVRGVSPGGLSAMDGKAGTSKGSELDEERPTQAWGHFGRRFGFGGWGFGRGFGFGGWGFGRGFGFGGWGYPMGFGGLGYGGWGYGGLGYGGWGYGGLGLGYGGWGYGGWGGYGLGYGGLGFGYGGGCFW